MNIKVPIGKGLWRRVSLLGFLIIICCVLVLSCTDESIPTYTSPAVGTDWELRAEGVASRLTGIAWNGEVFAVVGDSSVFTSADARTWQLRYGSAPGELHTVCWSGKEFIAVGDGCILVSEDGITWRLTEVGEALNGVAASDTMAVAIGDSGVVLTSHDLVTWRKDHCTYGSLTAIIWDSNFVYPQYDSCGAFVLCGEGIVARYRRLEETAQFTRIGGDYGWMGLVERGSIVVLASYFYCFGIMGTSGHITGNCVGSKFRAITPFGKEFVAVGTGGWAINLVLVGDAPGAVGLGGVRYRTPVESNLNAITVAGNGCVAVGDDGVVVASPPNRSK